MGNFVAHPVDFMFIAFHSRAYVVESWLLCGWIYNGFVVS